MNQDDHLSLQEDEILLTPDDLVKKWQVSTSFIYKLVREKKIQYFHLGKNARFSSSQAEEYKKNTMNVEYHRDRLKKKKQHGAEEIERWGGFYDTDSRFN